MFKPLSLYIGLRYIRAKRRNQFISFIALVSVVGIALGVAVLITVLSVMNGFDQEIRERIFTMVPHITVTHISGSIKHWQPLLQGLQKTPGVVGAAPTVTREGMLTHGDVVRATYVVGIDPTLETRVSDVSQKMVDGRFSRLKPSRFGIILGQDLATALGVMVGDSINLITPQATITPVGFLPRIKRMSVVGVFRVGTGFGFDNSVAFVHLSDAQTIFMMPRAATDIQMKTNDLFRAPSLAGELQQKYGDQYQFSDWTDRYGPFYRAVQMEKNMMFLILLLLIAIAAFNLISSLVMQVNDKQTDIAILRTFGATPRMIMKIFIIQGSLLGIAGTFVGVACGVFLSWHVTELVNFIQTTFHIQLLTSGVYFVDYLPSKVEASDIWRIAGVAILMSFLATLYPAWRAARTEPVEALRYE
jgi:lipoprotein-releasing system permease protein